MGGDDMKKQSKFLTTLLVAMILIGFLGVNKTQAWLLAKTGEKNNHFTVGTLYHEIEEEFDGVLKKNVAVTNTGETDAFVRVMVIPQWLDKSGTTILGLETTDTFEAEYNEEDWFLKEGFWYYRHLVTSGDATAVLVKSAQPKNNLDERYKNKVFNLQVVTQSVQGTPLEAVKELWGFDPSEN